MAVISFRIDDELKEKMRKYRHINWSEVVRAEIIKTIETLESRKVAEALLINERIRKKSRTGTAEIIREWRERRHGESGG